MSEKFDRVIMTHGGPVLKIPAEKPEPLKVGDQVEWTITRETSRGGYNFRCHEGTITKIEGGQATVKKDFPKAYVRVPVWKLSRKDGANQLTRALFAAAGEKLPDHLKGANEL